MKILVVALMLLIAGPLEAQRNCRTGKPCGNTCIARDKVCRVGTGSTRSEPTPAPPPSERVADPALASVGASSADEAQSAPPTERDCDVRLSANAPVLDRPRLGATVLAELAVGSRFCVAGPMRGFYRVYFGGLGVGWIAASHVTRGQTE